MLHLKSPLPCLCPAIDSPDEQEWKSSRHNLLRCHKCKDTMSWYKTQFLLEIPHLVSLFLQLMQKDIEGDGRRGNPTSDTTSRVVLPSHTDIHVFLIELNSA